MLAGDRVAFENDRVIQARRGVLAGSGGQRLSVEVHAVSPDGGRHDSGKDLALNNNWPQLARCAGWRDGRVELDAAVLRVLWVQGCGHDDRARLTGLGFVVAQDLCNGDLRARRAGNAMRVEHGLNPDRRERTSSVFKPGGTIMLATRRSGLMESRSWSWASVMGTSR